MGEVCTTVTSRWGTGGGNVPFVANRMVAFGEYVDDDTASAMKARDYKDATDLVAYSIREDAKANTFSATEIEVSNAIQALVPSVQSHHAQTFITEAIQAPALTTNDPSRSPQASEVTQQIRAVHLASSAVRRLTPIECERLQGFKDGHTNIPWRGKPESPDGLRYKALGNSMAVPCMNWIGKRISLSQQA